MFRRLCSNIRDGVDVFSINIHTSLMSKGFRMDTLNFRGETIVDIYWQSNGCRADYGDEWAI